MPNATEKKLTITAQNTDALLETPIFDTESVQSTKILTCSKDELYSIQVEQDETALVTIATGSIEISLDQVDTGVAVQPQSNTIRCTGPRKITTRCLTQTSSMTILTLRS